MYNPTAKAFDYNGVIYLGTDLQIASEKAFHLNSQEEKQVSFTVTMPGSHGTYPVYIGVFAGGQNIALYKANEDLQVAGPATEILRPDAPGSETNIEQQRPESGAHWDKVDEADPHDDTATAVFQGDSVFRRDLYNLQSHVGMGSITQVTVYALVKTLAATPTQTSLKLAIKSGATVAESDERMITPYFVSYFHSWPSSPQSGVAWTWSEIDLLQAGISLRCAREANPTIKTYCTQVYVEVDYT